MGYEGHGNVGILPYANVRYFCKVDTFTIETFLPGVQRKEDEYTAAWRDNADEDADLVDDETLVIEHDRNGKKWIMEITIKPPVIVHDYYDYEADSYADVAEIEPIGYVLKLNRPSLPQGTTVAWKTFEETSSDEKTWKETGKRLPLGKSTVLDPLKVGVQVSVTYVYWRSKWDFMSKEQMTNWDVAFLVNDKRFYAHRMVLSLVSTYFEKMFAGAFREAREKEVPLGEVDRDVFEAFLHCVYPCGTTDPPECYLLPLTYLADKFGVESLTLKCVEALKWTCEVSSVDKLQAAVKTNAPTLEDHVIESLTAADIKELVESDVKKELGEQRLMKILKKSATFI